MVKPGIYRQWLTVSLILLYGFVITPTQWWHNHEISFPTSSKIVSKDPTIPILDVESSTNCKICSHHYSYHNKEVVVVLPEVEEYFSPLTSEPTCFISLPFSSNLAERGPPSVALIPMS